MMMLTAPMLLAFLIIAVFGLRESARAQGNSTDAKRPESAFACNRFALTPQQRKRHFDELGPALRAIKKTIREVPNGYEFGFPADPPTVQLVSEWAAGEHLCCPFFDISIRLEREGGKLWWGLTGREGVKQFIPAEFSPWIKP